MTAFVYQFRISLIGSRPEVWRRIIVPSGYSFWDLHVAIQDSMGWFDCHLHAFRMRSTEPGSTNPIGIPDDDPFEGDQEFLAGWEIPIVDYFRKAGDAADYEYDFGDGWEHEVVLEEIAVRPAKTRFPVCIAGAGACPPEDCGGVSGYERFLEILGDPEHEEHEEMKAWAGGHHDPAAFEPKKVKFDNPCRRWKRAFQEP